MDKCEEATRWELLEETSPSGKTLYKCTQCGRKSHTPDKWCGTTCGDQLEHVEFLQGECNHLLRKFSDANTESREYMALYTALRAEVERLRTALEAILHFCPEPIYWEADIPGKMFVPIESIAREALGGE